MGVAGLLIAVSYAVHAVIQINTGGPDWWAAGGAALSDIGGVRVSLAAMAVCFSLLILMAWRVDINEFSLNAFYRNRLVRCYPGATRFDRAVHKRNPQNFTGFDDADDMALSELADGKTTGPLHLVNCALNLGGSSDLTLHTRHSAAFTLSPLHCRTAYASRDKQGQTAQLGYARTALNGGKGTPTLGQAISVSGAAASPNMGYHTPPVTAFLLTLFNVRLGWWFPHPDPRKGAAGRPSPRFNLRYLLAELFGGATDTSTFLMVSDGGHFENGGTHPDGILIYLKASMASKEETSVRQYKSSHPTFPHETTGDQFYGEDQFESYRLGRDAAARAFDGAAPDADVLSLARTLLENEHRPPAADA